jgi:MFS family permease
MLAQLLATAGRIAAPFYILSAGRVVKLDGATLGSMSLAFLGADTITNMGWGYTGDRFGFRSTFMISLVLWIGATVLLIAAPHLPTVHWAWLTIGGVAWVFISFFGLGAAQSGQMMSSSTMVLEFGTREDMAMRLALTQTAQGLTFAVGPLLGSLLVTFMGYDPLFMVSIGCLTLGLVILTVLVKEPRTARLRDRD